MLVTFPGSRYLPLLAALVLTAGCSHGPATSVQNEAARSDLSELWEMYNGYVLQNHRPPASIGDFKGLQIPYPRGHSAITTGRCVVRFGTPLEPVGAVVAYEKDAAQQGGLALVNDGSIKMMSAADVQAAIK
jgi:hypothetical protein